MKMNKVVDFVNKREKRFSKGNEQPAAFHSRTYHRHFEDWAEVQRAEDDGHVHIERVYVGTYYISSLSRRKQVLLKIGFVLAWLTIIALFIAGAVQQTEANSLWYVTVFEAVATASLFWMLIALVHYLTAPEKKTINDYRSSSLSVQNSSILATAALFLTALFTLIQKMIHFQDASGKQWLSIVVFLLAGVLCFGVNRVEKRAPYAEIPSDREAPEGSIVID